MNATIIIRILNTNAVLFSPRCIVNFCYEFSQYFYLIPDRVKWRMARQVVVPYRGVHLSRSRVNVSIVGARIERDCKFISERRAGGRRRAFQRPYAQLFLLFAYFFLDESRLSPFVLKWTSCHYTPCYSYFFRRFYRVLRGEGVPFGKMFVLRASVLESLRVE